MRLSSVLLALLCPIAVVAVETGKDAPPAQEVLGIVTSFAQEPPPEVLARVRVELESLLRLPILRLDWRSLETLPAYQTFDHLVVAHFAGRCEIPVESRNRSQPMVPALGYTHVSDGQVIPFLHIDCDRITRLLGPAKGTDPRALRDLRMGRALARVLAHEIYHIVAETKEHAQSGIAKPELSARDLTCEQMGFEKTDLERMRVKVAESMRSVTSQRPGTD